METLELYLSQSGQEYDNAKKLESSDEYYLAYRSLLREQETMIADIKRIIIQIDNICSSVENASESTLASEAKSFWDE